jgi:hypothetical protein
MKIACLGWGSLIWRPESLLIRREWFADGPILPIEFTRKSNDGRLTLVISETAQPVRTLWALMATDNLETAKNSLMIREGISAANLNVSIGAVSVIENTDDVIKNVIKNWAIELGLDAVIWTSLKSKFKEVGVAPSLEEAVFYLRSLDVNKRSIAEEYIRKAPKQIDTEFRRKFEIEFGWKYQE